MNFQEHLLGEVVDPAAIRREPPDHPVHKILVLGDEIAERLIIISLPAPLDERAFIEIRHSATSIRAAPAGNCFITTDGTEGHG